MTTDMKDILTIAAASPDPAVRSAAIRYKQLEAEIAALDGFFSFYGQARNVPASLPELPATPVVKAVKHKSNGRSRGKPVSASALELVACIKSILTGYGQPMHIGPLHQAYLVVNPGSTLKYGALRQQLVRRRKEIGMIESRGYWPVGVDVPDAVPHSAE